MDRSNQKPAKGPGLVNGRVAVNKLKGREFLISNINAGSLESAECVAFEDLDKY